MATTTRKNPFLSGFLVGLFVGLALALAVAFLITRSNPFISNEVSDKPSTSGKNTPPVEAPRYEFDTPINAEPAAAASESTGYFLQAGAFTKAGDADQMKARLALLGFEARVITSNHADAPLNKVHIGPYKALDELNTARARLTQGGIETILIKIPPQNPAQAQEKP